MNPSTQALCALTSLTSRSPQISIPSYEYLASFTLEFNYCRHIRLMCYFDIFNKIHYNVNEVAVFFNKFIFNVAHVASSAP